jgi:predicted GIY-YIG superfamily endonuclease
MQQQTSDEKPIETSEPDSQEGYQGIRQDTSTKPVQEKGRARMTDYVIYALVDPEEEYKVCYVGMTSDVYERFYRHLRDVDKHTLKGQWLRHLRHRNCIPLMRKLEVVHTLEEAREREVYWIHFYRQLHMPLTNASIPQLPVSPSEKPTYPRVPAVLFTEQEEEQILHAAKDLPKNNGKIKRTALRDKLRWNNKHYPKIAAVCDKYGM